jgi:phage terminase small subunit
MAQLHLLHLPGHTAHGVFGAFDTEWLHFTWNNGVTLAVFMLLARYPANRWLWLTALLAGWHGVEHTVIIWPYVTAGVRGSPGLLAAGGALGGGLPVRAVELHAWYNLAETVPLLLAFAAQCRRTTAEAKAARARAMAPGATAPKPPEHLRPGTQKWWNAVVDEFELEAQQLNLLTLAAESWDRCQEAREAIARDGAYLRDRFGRLKAHPSTAVERDCRIAFARLLRELALDEEARGLTMEAERRSLARWREMDERGAAPAAHRPAAVRAGRDRPGLSAGSSQPGHHQPPRLLRPRAPSTGGAATVRATVAALGASTRLMRFRGTRRPLADFLRRRRGRAGAAPGGPLAPCRGGPGDLPPHPG